MKLCLLGAQGTGKSTLLSHFSEYKIIDNVARSVIAKGGKSNQEGNARSQRAIFNNYEKALRKPSYLSTRSVIDVLAYTKYLVLDKKVKDIRTWFEKLTLLYEYNREIRRTIKWIKNNPEIVLCYVPVEIPLENDGVRSMNVIYRDVIDHIMYELFEKVPVVYKYVIKGTLEQRIKQLKLIIETF